MKYERNGGELFYACDEVGEHVHQPGDVVSKPNWEIQHHGTTPQKKDFTRQVFEI
jgi:hypothetical protein